MAKNISISDDELVGFTDQAAIDFEASVTAFKADLLREIGLIEAGQGAGSGGPEITSRMVKEAEVVFARGSIYRKKKSGEKALKTVSVLSLFIAGAMVQKDNLSSFPYLITFLVVVGIAIFTNILVHMRD